MTTKHISKPEYDQLSDSEKAGYELQYQGAYGANCEFVPLSKHGIKIAELWFAKHPDTSQMHEVEIIFRKVYVPIHPTPFPETISEVEKWEQQNEAIGNPDVNFPVDEMFGGLQKRMVHPTPDREPEEKKEYILCAAIWFNDGKSHDHQPVNIDIGFVVTGRRHQNCYATLSSIADSIGLEERIKMLLNKADRDKQGFVTNLNRYVDRKEGYQIAKAANQLLHNMHDQSDPILISEDLY